MDVLMGVRPMMGAARFARSGPGMDGFGPLALLLFLVIAAAVVALVVWAVLRRPKTATLAGGALAADPAIAIARERLARGEIDAEQYMTIVSALGGEQRSVSAPQG